MLKHTNEQIVLHNTYGKHCRLTCIVLKVASRSVHMVSDYKRLYTKNAIFSFRSFVRSFRIMFK